VLLVARKTTGKWIGLVLLLFAVIGSSIGFYAVFAAPFPAYVSENGSSAALRIESGMSFAAVTKELEALGLVGNEKIFRLRARLKGYDRQIQAGVYVVEPGETVENVLDKMAQGQVAPSLKVTIPEGYNIRQIATRLEQAGVIDGDVFLQEIKDFQPDGLVLPQNEFPIEGFLFPDTYTFALQETTFGIATRMYNRFNQVVGADYARLAAEHNMTLLEAVTLASIIEKEIRVGSERQLAAGVFLRRIQVGMPLQSCATVQYLLPQPKARLTYADLEIQSPYNTYLHPGFPPGPIANPGRDSLMAAVQPQDEGFLYFVAKKDGSHVFSKTFAEHKAAQQRINNE